MLEPDRMDLDLNPGMVMSHGWVERGSSQVIQLSNTEVRYANEFLILVI